MNKKLFLLIIRHIFYLGACINQYGIKSPPLNSRKLKRKIAPPYEFNHAMMNYRKQYGYWPKSVIDFQAYNSKAIQKIYLAEFSDWYLGANTNDSLNVHFVHVPVSDGAHIGGIPIPTKQVKIKTLYVFSKGIIKTQLHRKRPRD